MYANPKQPVSSRLGHAPQVSRRARSLAAPSPHRLYGGACRAAKLSAHKVLSLLALARPLCAPQLLNAGKDLSTFKEEEFQDHFEATYEDIWEEVTKYGEVRCPSPHLQVPGLRRLRTSAPWPAHRGLP